MALQIPKKTIFLQNADRDDFQQLLLKSSLYPVDKKQWEFKVPSQNKHREFVPFVPCIHRLSLHSNARAKRNKNDDDENLNLGLRSYKVSLRCDPEHLRRIKIQPTNSQSEVVCNS